MTSQDILKAALLPLVLAACGQSLQVHGSEHDADAALDAPNAPRDAAARLDASVADAVPPHDAGVRGDTSIPDAGAPRDAQQRVDAFAPGACGGSSVVTFHLQASTGDAGLLYARSSNPGDGIWWFSVADDDGTPVQLFLKTATRCDACIDRLIPVGFTCSSLPDGGVTAAWDGTIFTGESSCLPPPAPNDQGEPISCDVPSCAPAGRYVVTMCASPTCSYVRDGVAGNASQSGCVSIPFDFPSNAELVGTL